VLQPVPSKMIPFGMAADYSSWYDAPVVLRVAPGPTRRCEVQLECTITGESKSVVHVHTGRGDQDIWKSLILAVEESTELRRRQAA
jgi:hypothetical protein